jgi:hypothetical protein
LKEGKEAMTWKWREPTLFNDYHSAGLKHGVSVTLERDGGVEIIKEGNYPESDSYIYLTFEELERLVRAARALKEYQEAYEKENG